MQTIDAHQHFWRYNPVRDKWITEEMGIIQRDFFPLNLGPVLRRNRVDGCVVIQSDESEKENEFQLTNANYNDFIKGVVGWVDFKSPNLEDRLVHYKQFKKMKGFRHILQHATPRDLMLQPHFRKGMELIGKYGYTYDLLVLPDQLGFAEKLASRFHDQRFVLDHMAKPNIKEKAIDEWKRDIVSLARHENVYCKISGLVTECDWNRWRPADILPYIEVVVEAFGTRRIMFGSDWPVCLLAATYEKVLLLMKKYFASFSPSEREHFFGGNAIRFYDL